MNVTYDLQFRRDANGIIRPLVHGGTSKVNSILTFVKTTGISNPLVHSQGAMGALAHELNGMLNGTIMGTVYASGISGVVGVNIGGLGGAVTNAQQRWEEQEGMGEISFVTDGLQLGADGGRSSSSSSSSSGITLPVGGRRMHRWTTDIISWRCIGITMVRGIG